MYRQIVLLCALAAAVAAASACDCADCELCVRNGTCVHDATRADCLHPCVGHACRPSQECHLENARTPACRRRQTQSARCLLPMTQGPCEAAIASFYFDADAAECRAFTYGGCLGNANRFSSLERCEAACVDAADNSDAAATCADVRCPAGESCVMWERAPTCVRDAVCLQPLRAGVACAPSPLSKIRPNESNAYHYNYVTDTCEFFQYAGCAGNRNRFNTTAECEQKCRRRPRDGESTTKPEHTCANIGCAGDTVCAHSPAGEPYCVGRAECTLPADLGRACANDTTTTLAYVYAPEKDDCDAILRQKCGGNANSFDTQRACRMACRPAFNTGVRRTCADVRCATGACAMVADRPVCQRRPECTAPINTGVCKAAIPRYAYSPADDACVPFTYGGCGANGNNFVSAAECETACVRNGTTERSEPITCETILCAEGLRCAVIEGRAQCAQPCQVLAEVGQCRAAIRQYTYDAAQQKCVEFVWGGCGSASNRYSTMSACNATCKGVTPLNACGRCEERTPTGKCVRSRDHTCCAGGRQPAQCTVDPCAVSKCAAATHCRADYCQGCNAVFYDANWNRVPAAMCGGARPDTSPVRACDECQREVKRPDGSTGCAADNKCCPPGEVIECRTDPCESKSLLCPDAVNCVSTSCGQCQPHFYDANWKPMNKTQCQRPVDRVDNPCGACKEPAVTDTGSRRCVRSQDPTCCPAGVSAVQCFVDPCPLAMEGCPRAAYCRADYCGGCKAVLYDQYHRPLSDRSCATVVATRAATASVTCGACEMRTNSTNGPACVRNADPNCCATGSADPKCTAVPCAQRMAVQCPVATHCRIDNCGSCGTFFYDADYRPIDSSECRASPHLSETAACATVKCGACERCQLNSDGETRCVHQHRGGCCAASETRCLRAPCAGVSVPEGGICRDDYCGGCTARRYDALLNAL